MIRKEIFSVRREISIDAGHRVPTHETKCRNLHGHRYRVQAVCTGPLAGAGSERDMVIDFGFLKEELMGVVDAACDHGTMLWVDDPLLPRFDCAGLLEEPLATSRGRIDAEGFHLTSWAGGKLYLLDRVPTAEALAAHWFERLAPRIASRSAERATLAQVRVWETPNCVAAYPMLG